MRIAALLAIIASGATFAAPDVKTLRQVGIAVAVDGDVVPWVTVRSLDDKSADITVLALERSDEGLTLKGDAPLLVCAGADGAATQCTLVDPLDTSRLDFALTPGIHVQGMLRDVAADEGAILRIRPERLEARRPIVMPLFRLDEALAGGIDIATERPFEICHIEPGRYVFEFTLSDGHTQAFDVAVHERPYRRTVDLGTFSIEAGVAMSIEVTDEQGIPVPHALVGVSQPDETQPGGQRVAQTQTDGRGRAMFRHLAPTAPMHVGCISTGFARTQDDLPAPPGSYACVLRRLAAIVGNVRDRRGPVANAKVSVDPAQSTSTDLDGRFRIGDLPPGKYYVHAVAPQYAHIEREAIVSSGDTLDIGTILLTPGEGVTGRILEEATGEPIRGAIVTVPGRSENAAVTAADDGRFHLVLDPAGEPIRIAAAGYAELDVYVSPDEGQQEFRLKRPGALTVRVWHEGRACVGCVVTADGPGRGWSARTDARGEAHFEQLGPGTYYVGYETARAATTHIAVSGGSTQPAEVRSGSRTNVELGAPEQTLAVYLTPAPDESWRLIATTSTTSATAERTGRGEFSVARHELATQLVLSRGGVSVVVGVIPPHYAPSSVTFALGTGSVVITVPREAQLTAEMLEIRTLRGEPVAWAPLTSDVTWTIPHLRSDTFIVTAGAKPLSSPFVVGAGPTVLRLAP